MSFLQRLIGRGKPTSSQVAKRRLQLVLVHDRTNISPGLLAKIKDEIIQVISRYIEVDYDGVEVNFTQHGQESRLVADVPLGNSRTGTSQRD